MWPALPCDLHLDIFRRLETAAVIRCAGACRHWRRSIIDNARWLRPHPDCFFQDLLIGFWDLSWSSESHGQVLQYVPACNITVPLFTPATTAGVSVDGRLYNYPLASRDGFLLHGEDKRSGNLCLWNAMTGICRVLPVAASDTAYPRRCSYILATGHDADDYSTSGDSDEMAVWILAVQCKRKAKDGTSYQIFTSRTGTWGPVKRSVKFADDLEHVYPDPCGSTVVCRGAVSWFVLLFTGRDALDGRMRTCMFSMDLRTERTWTTELPVSIASASSLVLAVGEDNRVSVVRVLPFRDQIEVWVMVGDGKWTMQWTIDNVEKVLPNCPSMRHMDLSGFCQRSGYLFGTGRDDRNIEHHFLIGIDGSSPQLIGTFESSSSPIRFPYEMDWSTYISSCISKMKYF